MKIEDMKFPIKVEFEEGDKIYQITFDGRPWLKECCDSKLISGWVESKTIPDKVEGFKEKKYIEWEYCERFFLCPICGKLNISGLDEDDYISKVSFSDMGITNIIRNAWLKLVDEK